MLKKIVLISMIVVPFALFGAGKSRIPYIGYIYPAGAKRGADIQVIVGGMNLRNVTDAEISGTGIKVKSVKFTRPFKRLSNDLKRELKPILKAIYEGKDPIAESKKNSEKLIARLKKQRTREAKLAEEEKGKEKEKSATTKPIPAAKNNDYEKMLNIVPGERLIYIDMTPKEVVKRIKALPPIEYECLLKDVFSRRNSLQTAPAIEQTAILELKISLNAPLGFRKLRLKGKQGISNELLFIVDSLQETTADIFRIDQKNPPQPLKLRTITNGRIMPGEVDKYLFKAKAGQNYSFELLARALVPYLSDAVPGWFQAIMSIHNKEGKTLAFADDNLFHPDPILSFKAPSDGEYELRIRDSIYRGREDFVYRLKTISGKPHKIKTKPLVLKNKLPKKTDSEPNNSLKVPQKISFPAIVSGKIDNPGDVDVFCLNGKKGQKIVAEIFARRLDSPMDSLLQLTDAQGEILAWNDDYKWLNIGIKTHHSDSYLLYELPENGKYFIKVSDTQRKGGKGFDYKLRLDKPRPNFKVFMTPSAINTRSFLSTPITLKVFREDGFNGAIDVFVKKGPKGLTLSGAHIPAGIDKITITIAAPRKIKPGLHDITLIAKAKIEKKEIVNNVISTDEIMQAFLYTHLVPTEKTTLNITRRGWLPVKPFTAKSKNVSIAPGGKYDFKLFDFQNKDRRKKKREKKEIIFKLLSPPKGISLTKTGYKNKHYLLQLSATPETKPWQGNLIIECVEKGVWKKKGKQGVYSNTIGYLPAVPVKITEK